MSCQHPVTPGRLWVCGAVRIQPAAVLLLCREPFRGSAGAAIVPAKAGFPGTDQKKKGAVFFATGGERGVLRLWRSDTGQCVYEHRCGVL